MAGDGKANKNQTATERAAAAMGLSGKVCEKCGEAIMIKDLLNVQRKSLNGNGKVTASYHRRCYGL